MGISVTLVATTDEEIRRFSSDAAALSRRFHAAGAGPSCHLNDFWDGLDFVLTAASGDALPLAVIKRGDVRYPDADDPSHAIFAATTRRLAQELSILDEAELRRRYDPPAMLGDAGGRVVYPGRLWIPAAADRAFGELMGYFRGLRRCVDAAAAAGLGLVVYRYEDF
jgi:hypothetical protein